MTILQFPESLVRSLLFGMPFEKMKLGSRQKSIGQTKRKLADQKLEEKEGTARDRRWANQTFSQVKSTQVKSKIFQVESSQVRFNQKSI